MTWWLSTDMSTCRRHLPVFSSHITRFVTRLAQWMPLAEQELLTLSELLSSPPVFSGVRVTRSIVLCVCFVDRCLSFFFWPLCCLSFDIQILITPLVSLQTYKFCFYSVYFLCQSSCCQILSSVNLFCSFVSSFSA